MVEVANLTWVVGPTCCFSVVCVAVVAHLILFFGTPLIHLVHFTVTVSCFALIFPYSLGDYSSLLNIFS